MTSMLLPASPHNTRPEFSWLPGFLIRPSAIRGGSGFPPNFAPRIFGKEGEKSKRKTFDTLDTSACLGPHYLVRCFRAALSSYRTSMVGVEYLRRANAGIDPQFQFSCYYKFLVTFQPSQAPVMG